MNGAFGPPEKESEEPSLEWRKGTGLPSDQEPWAAEDDHAKGGIGGCELNHGESSVEWSPVSSRIGLNSKSAPGMKASANKASLGLPGAMGSTDQTGGFRNPQPVSGLGARRLNPPRPLSACQGVPGKEVPLKALRDIPLHCFLVKP